MPTTTAFRGGASVRALKEGDTSITITAGSIVKTIPVSVWGNKWVLPTLPATRNGITFTAAGDGMVHAKGTATDWATILVTQDLPAGEYTLEHTLVDGVGPFCELKSTDGRIDLFSHGKVKATLPAGDYRMLVSVSPGKTVDATITPILRKLNKGPDIGAFTIKGGPNMGALSITGIKPGSTSLKLTAGKITKTVPITVLSRNLLSYGPAEGNGLTATVNTDGSLHVTGAATGQWRGLSWTFPCPVQGTVKLSGTSIAGLSFSIKCLDAKGQQLGDLMNLGNSVMAIPAGTVSLFLNVISTEATPTAKDGDLRIQLESGTTAHEWMRPGGF